MNDSIQKGNQPNVFQFLQYCSLEVNQLNCDGLVFRFEIMMQPIKLIKSSSVFSLPTCNDQLIFGVIPFNFRDEHLQIRKVHS